MSNTRAFASKAKDFLIDYFDGKGWSNKEITISLDQNNDVLFSFLGAEGSEDNARAVKILLFKTLGIHVPEEAITETRSQYNEKLDRLFSEHGCRKGSDSSTFTIGTSTLIGNDKLKALAKIDETDYEAKQETTSTSGHSSDVTQVSSLSGLTKAEEALLEALREFGVLHNFSDRPEKTYIKFNDQKKRDEVIQLLELHKSSPVFEFKKSSVSTCIEIMSPVLIRLITKKPTQQSTVSPSSQSSTVSKSQHHAGFSSLPPFAGTTVIHFKPAPSLQHTREDSNAGPGKDIQSKMGTLGINNKRSNP